MDCENIFSLVGTSSYGEETVWGKLCMSSNHEADVDKVDISRANHLHGPREQIFVLVRTCSIVKEDGQSMNPGMLLMELIPVVS